MSDGSKRTVVFGEEIPGTDATAAAEGDRIGAVRFAPLATLTKPVNEFRSKSLVDTPVSEITRVTVVQGPNRVVCAGRRGRRRLRALADREPRRDLACGAFVDQLLADLSSAQISDFPPVSATDLPRIGLAPPAAVVTLQKGTEVVATLSFGAAKADSAGKDLRPGRRAGRRRRRPGPGELGKELSAFREVRLLPVDACRVRRVQFESGDLRAGAEKVEGEWRSGERTVAASIVETSSDGLSRSESRGFVAERTTPPGASRPAEGRAARHGRDSRGRERLAPHGEVLPGGLGGGTPLVAAEVSGRPDALLVDAAVLDDLKRGAGRLRDAATEKPKETPKPRRRSPETGVALGDGAGEIEEARYFFLSAPDGRGVPFRSPPGSAGSVPFVGALAGGDRAVALGGLSLERGDARLPLELLAVLDLARPSSSTSSGASRPPGRASGGAGPVNFAPSPFAPTKLRAAELAPRRSRRGRRSPP